MINNNLKMPETVFSKLSLELIFEILKQLDGPDLLTLRRVCLKTKEMVDSFKNGKWTGCEVTLKNASDYQKYLMSNLQIPNIYITRYPANSTPQLSKFLIKCAPRIKRLRIGTFFGCQTEEEFNFFNAFSNLKKFKIDKLTLNFFVPFRPTRIPSHFKTLKVLNIKGRWDLKQPDLDYIKEMLKFCSQTRTLRFPTQSLMGVEQIYQFLMKIVSQPERQTLGKKIKIKWIDLRHVIDETGDPNCFYKFLQFCFKQEIRVMNLNAILMDEYFIEIVNSESYDYVKTIGSLIGVEPILQIEFLHFPWDNLECLKVASKEFAGLVESFEENDDEEEFQEPSSPWLPKLKSLSIRFNSSPWKFEGFKELEDSLKVLLPREGGQGYVRRTGLKELNLFFVRISNNQRKSLILSNLVDARRIIWNVPNLKTLRIQNWQTNQWENLFKGLPALEELSILDCNTFTDCVVIGCDDPMYPDFHQLKGLKKLTLKLDYMAGLTDKAFKEVFSRMPLIELKLIGGYKCDCISLTLKGIESLEYGLFRASVRKLSFQGLRLKGVSPKQLEEVKRIFPFYK